MLVEVVRELSHSEKREQATFSLRPMCEPFSICRTNVGVDAEYYFLDLGPLDTGCFSVEAVFEIANEFAWYIGLLCSAFRKNEPTVRHGQENVWVARASLAGANNRPDRYYVAAANTVEIGFAELLELCLAHRLECGFNSVDWEHGVAEGRLREGFVAWISADIRG